MSDLTVVGEISRMWRKVSRMWRMSHGFGECGRGVSAGEDPVQPARRFGVRPQDKRGDGLWARPKQLLLIPHRLAIALQETGRLVRNDNVWVKPRPVPEQVRDRCAKSHEYMFHFAKGRYYYYDRHPVGRVTRSGAVLPPLDTWTVDVSRGGAGTTGRPFPALRKSVGSDGRKGWWESTGCVGGSSIIGC